MSGPGRRGVKNRCNALFINMATIWNTYGFDVMMYHLLCNEILVYTFFLMSIYSAIYTIYSIIDFSSSQALLTSNLFTIMQGYGYDWISFAVQMSAILAFVLYTKFLLIYRRDLLRIQELTHLDVSLYTLFLYNVRAKTRDEDIIARIDKDLTYLKGTFAVPKEVQRPVTKEQDPRGDRGEASHVSMHEKVTKCGQKRWGRKGDCEREHHIDHIFSLERIRDLNVYHAKRRLAELETQYYNQIKANPQKLVPKRGRGASCLKALGIIKCMQKYGLLRDAIWYNEAIKWEKMKVQKMEAMSSETSKGMAIVIFKLASAKTAFYNHRQSYLGDRYVAVKGNIIRVTKAPSPSDVNWDNVHRGRAIFLVMFLCCLLLSLLLTSVVYLITAVIRAYQRIIASQTTSVITSLALSGSMYLVILLSDYLGRVLMTKIVQLERHHTTSAYETSYLLRYFIYIFINRLTPLYSRTILEYLTNLFTNLFKPLNLNNYYFFKIIDFTKDWRWGKDTPGRDILMYVILATVLDNTLDVILHYLQPAAWGECCHKRHTSSPEHLIERGDSVVEENTETISLVTTKAKYYCGCHCEFCRVRSHDEEALRLKLEYSMLYCRLASIFTYSLSFGYTQPVILPIACVYFLLQNIVGKCKLVYLSKPGRKFSTSLSSYFCNVLLTFSYLFATATLAQGYLSSAVVPAGIALSIGFPIVILFSAIFNTATICALIKICRCRRKIEKETSLRKSIISHSYGMLSKEIEEERRFNKMPIYDPDLHGEYIFQPTTGYSEKECAKLKTLLSSAISGKADDSSATPEVTEAMAVSKLRASPTSSQID